MNALRIALRNFMALPRDRAGFVWTMLMPLAFCYMFSLVNQGPQEQSATIELVDMDGGYLANAFHEHLLGDGLWIKRYTPENPPPENSWRRITLEEGFTEKILNNEDIRLPISDWPMSNNYDLTARLQVYRALVRFLATLSMAARESDGPPTAAVYERALEKQPLINLDVREAGIHAIPSGLRQIVPGMMVLFVMMNTVIYGGIILALDRTMGRLQRVMTTPTHAWELLSGHILGAIAIGGAQTIFFLVIGPLVFGVSWGAQPMALGLVLLGFLVFCASFAVCVGAFAGSEGQVVALSMLCTLAMAGMGGCWWPQEVIPASVQWILWVVPTGWAVDGIHRVISFGGGVVDILPNAAALFLFAAPFFVVGVARLRRGIA